MANLLTIVRLRPTYEEFLHERFEHRGDVLFFPSRHRSDVYSTDSRGFRHTRFRGEDLSVARILAQRRYGIVLGTSRAFGFGMAGNDKTIPSLLSQRFGFPFANIAMPQGNSRNLAALLHSFLLRTPVRPSAIVHFNSGDFTGLAISSDSDSVFGSPNRFQAKAERKRTGTRPQPGNSVRSMLSFTTLWTRWIAMRCRAHKVPLVLAHDSSYFEKKDPSPRDRECELGTAFFNTDKHWFAAHREFVHHFYERRESIAERMNIPLAGPGRSNDLGFIDEFHYDEDGNRALADDIGAALDSIL